MYVWQAPNAKMQNGKNGKMGKCVRVSPSISKLTRIFKATKLFSCKVASDFKKKEELLVSLIIALYQMRYSRSD